MNLRIMAQRLIMSDAFHRSAYCLFIDDISRVKGNLCPITLLNQALQDFNLDLSHDLRMNFPETLFPYQMKERFLFLQLPQL